MNAVVLLLLRPTFFLSGSLDLTVAGRAFFAPPPPPWHPLTPLSKLHRCVCRSFCFIVVVSLMR
jgi:hypothetical protein